MLGVAKLPDPPIQINAVAVRNLGGQASRVSAELSNRTRPLSPGMLTHDRLFVSSMPGSDPASGKVPDDPAAQVDLALDRMEAVVKAAGLDLSNMVFVNPYLTADIPARVMNERYAQRFEFGNTPARATIEVSSLPGGAHIEYTGVAVRDLKQRRAIVRRTCRPARRRVLVYLPATLCIVRPRVASFPDRTAASMPPPLRINSGRPCAIFSTTLKKRR